MKKILSVMLITLALASGVAVSHSGGTNSDGCHHDHKNGGYHCH